MNIRERIDAFWSGERPDRIPFTIYQNEWRHWADDPAWPSLFRAGLGISWPIASFRSVLRDAELREETYLENGRPMLRQAYQTPLGDISATWLVGDHSDDWPVKYWLESAQDYRVMTFLVEHTAIEPDYAQYNQVAESLPEYCVPHASVGNSPMLKMMLDLTGMENFIIHLYEENEAVMGLYAALCKQFKRICEIVAGGPGRYVANPESFSAETFGPRRFKQWILPVYEENFPQLRSAGKIIGSHFDGKTAVCKEMIRGAPIDLIESLTPPPEGDQSLAEARQAWPDKLFWCNINVSAYGLPARELADYVLELSAQAAPDGRRLAFEISEHSPVNWERVAAAGSGNVEHGPNLI